MKALQRLCGCQSLSVASQRSGSAAVHGAGTANREKCLAECTTAGMNETEKVHRTEETAGGVQKLQMKCAPAPQLCRSCYWTNKNTLPRTTGGRNIYRIYLSVHINAGEWNKWKLFSYELWRVEGNYLLWLMWRGGKSKWSQQRTVIPFVVIHNRYTKLLNSKRLHYTHKWKT